MCPSASLCPDRESWPGLTSSSCYMVLLEFSASLNSMFCGILYAPLIFKLSKPRDEWELTRNGFVSLNDNEEKRSLGTDACCLHAKQV